jgi:flavin-binding protein dodecin
VVNGHAQLALLDTGAESEAATNLRAILDAVQRASDTLHTMGQRLEDGAEVARRTRGANPRKRQTA